MGQFAAKLGDKVVGVDIHIVMVPTPGGEVPTPMPSPFNGIITGNVSTNVLIMGKPAATFGSKAINAPPHIPQGTRFQVPPTNEGTILQGSTTVLINSKPAARLGDSVLTCNDPAPALTCKVVATGTVLIG
jgi:uncharacterized Zn-binding protein involved in type VI secretion